ncbi:MAG: hypothetical protein DRQ88_05340 [Epsilonproteobacteria bacterium]|nr:MAG: hypothetical protein DRQ89_04415 [Campylobacterota bacterium]RLA66852.1 MAG: hypothetical protein DRQ88_05340 [Campylobacterota bacterium]
MKLLLLIFFTLFSWNALGDLKITGNNRTQDKFIKFIFKRCLKKTNKPSELSQCIMNERIFHNVTILKTKAGWNIDVKERWTLIPIPRFEADTQGNKYYGLGLIESNLFGRRIITYMQFLTGTVSQFSIFYIDPSFLLTNNVFRWRVKLDHNDLQQVSENEFINGFNEREWRFNVGFGHEWGPSILTGIVEYSNKNYDPLKNYDVPKDYEKLSLGFNFFYDTRDFKLSYDQGFSALVRLRLQLYRSDEAPAANTLSGIVNYTRQGFWDHILKVTGHFSMTTTDDERDALKKGRTRGFRGTLQYSIWAKSYAGLILGYDVPLIKWDFGTWVAGLFSDLTYINNINNLPATKFYSGGVGTYFYLKKLMVPGIGIEYGWQNKARSTFWAFNVGFTF